ncbi:major facilitator transporter [Nannochloropsis oceanica]
MGLASACIGLLPTEDTWGWGSWYLLLSLHALQGLAVGGEWGGCLLLVYEFCRHDRNKGLVSALPQAGRALGFMLSSYITASLYDDTPSPSDADNGGGILKLPEKDLRWRLAHALAIGLLLLALHLRLRIPESPEFRLLQKHQRLRSWPLGEALKTQTANILWVLGALWLDGVVQVMVVGWGLPTLLAERGISIDALLFSLSIAAFVEALFTVVGGWLGDRVGRRKLFFVASMSIAVGTVFYFHALFQLSSPTRVVPMYVANILYLGVAYGMLQGAFPALLVEVFPSNVRYSGVSLVYNISRVYSSGAWPYVSQALLAAGKGSKFSFLALENGVNPVGLVLFVSLVAVVAAVSVLMIQIYSSGGRGGVPLPFNVLSRRSKVREHVGGGIQQQLQREQMEKGLGVAGEEGQEEENAQQGGVGMREQERGMEFVGQGSWRRRGRRREERSDAGGGGLDVKTEEQKYYLEGEEEEEEDYDDDIDDSYYEDGEEEEDDQDDSASSVFSDFDEEREQDLHPRQ